MDPCDALNRLAAVLDAERAAIRSLDGAALERHAAEKDAILGTLRSAVARGDSTALGGLRALAEPLRRNVILLAHARDCLGDALGLDTPPGTDLRRQRRTDVPTPHRLSLRG